LIVEGDKANHLLQDYATRTPAARAVIRCLLEMVEASSLPVGAAMVHDGHLYTVPWGVTSFYEKTCAHHMRIELNTKMVGKILRLICLDKGDPVVREVPGCKDTPKQRWWDVDLRVLMHEALASGAKRERLENLFLVHHTSRELERLYHVAEPPRVARSEDE